MRRRNFLLASGSTILTGGVTGILNKPSIGVEFDISGTPTEDPSNVRSIFISFDTLSIEPRYIDTKESARVEVLLEVDDHGVDSKDSFITLRNGQEKDISAEFDPLVVDGINANNQSYISGTVSVEIDHPSIKDTYDRRFNINDNLIPSSTLTQDLVAWYRFEDGDARDYASDDAFPGFDWGDSTKYDGTINGTTHKLNSGISDFEYGEDSGAFDFNGSGDYIDVSSASSAVDYQNFPFSVCGWAYYRSFNGNDGHIIGGEQSGQRVWNIGPIGSSEIKAGTYDGDGQGVEYSASYQDSWVHVCMTIDSSGTINAYHNGQYKGSDSTGTLSNSSPEIYIGAADFGHSPRYADALIDDVRIYNKELSDSEVVDIYNETKPF
jgi:hypothetical protein